MLALHHFGNTRCLISAFINHLITAVSAKKLIIYYIFLPNFIYLFQWISPKLVKLLN